MVKFGYPSSLVREYDNWVVLVRPGQCTLGALVLVNKAEIQSFSGLGAESFAELERVVKDVEGTLKAFRPYQKINYLMLMMVDKEVHFHVLPRYERDQAFDGAIYPDSGWPGMPDLASGSVLDARQMTSFVGELKKIWAS